MKINIENLTKLADFLENEVKDEQFDIYAYRKKFGDDYPFFSKSDCGTVGCALGWLPFISSDKDVHICSFSGEVDFGELSKRVLGLYEFGPFGQYMFSSKWVNYEQERTREATIRRIRNVISGLPKTELRLP